MKIHQLKLNKNSRSRSLTELLMQLYGIELKSSSRVNSERLGRFLTEGSESERERLTTKFLRIANRLKEDTPK
jgi:hypothetical protein